MTPSERLNELHRRNRAHLGTVERYEPTEIDKLARGLFKDLCAALALVMFLGFMMFMFIAY